MSKKGRLHYVRGLEKILFTGVLIGLIQLFTFSAYAAGKLKVEPLHFDCGTVQEGSPANMDAVLENVGDQDIAITNVRTN